MRELPPVPAPPRPLPPSGLGGTAASRRLPAHLISASDTSDLKQLPSPSHCLRLPSTAPPAVCGSTFCVASALPGPRRLSARTGHGPSHSRRRLRCAEGRLDAGTGRRRLRAPHQQAQHAHLSLATKPTRPLHLGFHRVKNQAGWRVQGTDSLTDPTSVRLLNLLQARL